MRTDTGPVFKLEDYKPTDFVLSFVDLTFSLDPQQTNVTARLTLARRTGAKPNAPLLLDGDQLALDAIALNGMPLENDRYSVTPELLTIEMLPESESFELTVQTTLNPASNTQLMGLYQSSGTFCTQCEAEGFRRITYFLDRPDVLAVYTVRIEGDLNATPLLLSNGNCIDKGPLNDGRHFAIWHDPHPKPSYLFALVAGNLGVIHDRFVTMSGRDVALEIYVEHGKEARASYAMDALKRSMAWDEEVFGLEYDLDVFMIVAVSDFNMGAMENKGLNVFNDKYVLADAATATDQDYANIEAIVAHEYFHNWTGNRITCRDWFQLCLKEGLTVYRDHEFSADQRERAVKRIAEVRLLRAHQFPEDNGPLAHPVRPRSYQEINNFYTATVYEKGSEVVRMLRTILGAKQFKSGLELYFERHDGQAATIEQFLASFADVTSIDLTQFALWYEQPGTPNLTSTYSYDAEKQQLTISLTQSLKAPVAGAKNDPMHIPVAFGLLDPAGKDMKWSEVSGGDVSANGVMNLHQASQTFTFTGVTSEPVVSLLRGFSAPVTHLPGPSEDQLLSIARLESDEFARWDALNTLVTRKICGLLAQPDSLNSDDAIIAAVLRVAGDPTLGDAYRALCLTLPSEADISREIGHDIDPDAIFGAVKTMNDAVAAAGQHLFARIYHSLGDDGAFSPDAKSAGRRALRNRALHYLSLGDKTLSAASDAYHCATNMTDKAHALSVLAQNDLNHPATVTALDDFAKTHRGDAGVMDKWYGIQATVPGPNTLDKVIELSGRPDFSWDNPNRVRALLGMFAAGNPTGFNRADGRGYQYLCEIIAKLDRKNPQLASRLMASLRSWRNLEITRASAAKSALISLAAHENLSRDVREMVDRMLS